jgi:opacity protein-like surface antigen
MRSKLVLAALLTLTALPIFAQVGPAVKINGIPLGVGVGIVDYDTDYYRPSLAEWSGRMIGVSAWANYSIFRGFGVEVEGTSIFANKPPAYLPAGEIAYGSLKEETLQGGIIYKLHERYKLHPYAKALGGGARVTFPSGNPYYTVEDAGMYSISGGVEYRAWRSIFVRGQYQYQWWKGFRGDKGFNPQGVTIGATYYLRGVHRHY